MKYVRSTLAAVTFFALGACSETCTNRGKQPLPSVDGGREVALFSRSCGATTGYSTQISIVKAGEMAFGAGNVFRADDNGGAALATTQGGPWAEVRWLGEAELLVRYDSKSRVFQNAGEVDGVRITYEAVTR
ncbi:hypothetical protein [Sphingomonas sp.]|uniref:hypothetical protein n=1 Tax=Sphingomonas sp. TaxID=28214 RepID=UPI002DD68DC0|nr:hypothetical protein [Sphingomonas sp.]